MSDKIVIDISYECVAHPMSHKIVLVYKETPDFDEDLEEIEFDDGTIHIDGIEVGEKTCSAVRSKTVYLPQDLSFPCEYVDDLISLVLQIGKVKREKQVVAQLQQHLAILGLEAEIVNKRMSEMSGGQRQRLILAILALLDKSVWLLDEPTSALDDESRERVVQFLLALQRAGKTIVAVSHDARFAEQCSTIISID